MFKTRTRAERGASLEGTDVCFAPVLTLSEAPHHPHAVARGAFIEIDSVMQPAPAPRFSRTKTAIPTPPAHAGQHTREVLSDWGFNVAELSELGM